MIAPNSIFLGYGNYIFPKNVANGKSLVVMSTSNYSPSKLYGTKGEKMQKNGSRLKHISLSMGWLNLWPHFICSLIWKMSRVFFWGTYIVTTNCKCWFKWLHFFFLKNEIKLKQCSSSTKPKTWTIITSTSFTYFGNEWDNNYNALMAFQMFVRAFAMVGLTLLETRPITF